MMHLLGPTEYECPSNGLKLVSCVCTWAARPLEDRHLKSQNTHEYCCGGIDWNS